MSVDPTLPTAAEDAVLAHAARRGTPVVLIGHLVSQLMGFGTLAVLYRLLKPDDYGLLGMILPAVMLPRMAATLGPGVAILQQQKLSQRQLSSLFWLQVIAGLLAGLLTSAISWFLAWKYALPSLLPVGLALAAGTVFAALGNQHQALLERDLRFRTGAALRLVGQLVACAGSIAYAWFWPNIWALVVQHVSELLVLWLGSWLLAPWRPDWPTKSRPGKQRSANQPHLRFSVAYSLSMLLQFLGQNIEKVLIPLFVGASGNHALGLYSQAFGLMIKPVYLLTTPLTGVMISSLAKTQPGSPMFGQLINRFYRLAAIGLFPCAVGLTLVASEVMTILGGPRWSAAGVIFRWLAPSLATIGLGNLAIFVLAARGQGRLLASATGIWLLLILQATGLGFWWAGQLNFGNPQAGHDAAYRGAVGIAAAFTIVQSVVWCVPFLWCALRAVGVEPRPVLVAMIPSLRASLVMGALVFALQWFVFPAVSQQLGGGNSLLKLFGSALAGVAIYTALAWRELTWLRHEWGRSPA